MKKIIFFTTFDYPTRFAHPVHGLEMATAFQAILKEDFLFIINTIKDSSLLEGINFITPFGKKARLIKKMHLRFVAYFIWLPLFFIKNKRWNSYQTIVFLNDPMLVIIAVLFKNFFRYKVVFECHGLYAGWQNFFIFHFSDKIIVLTKNLADKILTTYPHLKNKNIVLSNAVDVSRFINEEDDKKKLREFLSLPLEAIIIGYTGRLKPLDMDKGAYLIIESLLKLPVNVQALFVGGTKKEIAEYSLFTDNLQLSERVHFVEHIDKNEIPKFTKACDILAYVPKGDNLFFQRETSPMKLFEYMSSNRPIITSDLPTTREILNESSTFFVVAGDQFDFVKKVEYILDNPLEASSKSDVALNEVRYNTWVNRAKKIVDFV